MPKIKKGGGVMAELAAKFKIIDEMSSALTSISDYGARMVEQWEETGTAINIAMNNIDSISTQTASGMNDISTAMAEAAEQTDYWTDAIGNYDKGAMEAIFTTEELVEAGYKTVDALEEQEAMFAVCEQAAGELSKAMENTAEFENMLAEAQSEVTEQMEVLNTMENISVEVKDELTKATENVELAIKELEQAYAEAEAAMQAYDNTIISGTTDQDELSQAAERASQAAENLVTAQNKASEATEELSEASKKAAEAAENSGQTGIDAVEGIANALAAAGITAEVKAIAEATYELVDAFSEAEQIVVNATGATGAALDELTASMMDAYSIAKSADLNSVAGAIGEINTRMGLTGEILTDVTSKFLDYANITGTNVVGSVQNITKVMNKWNVEQEKMESLMDKLAYAGQISGASVDSLSQTLITGAASFQNAGFSLDNTISMLADFELAGINSTTAITAVRTAINNFTDDGLNAEAELQRVITQIANMEDASEATALAVDTFGSRAGQELALAIQNGTLSVDTFNSTLDEAQGTLAKTAEAGETLGEKWEKANKNISSAFTKVLEPTLHSISEGLAEFMNGMGDFLNEHPLITKAITALGVGLGAAALGVAGVAAASLTAIPAVAALGTAINVALGPISAIALGIAAVTGAVLVLNDAFNDEIDISTTLTQSSQDQYNELQKLNEEYEKACEIHGALSPEAAELKVEVDELSESFEANKKTIGDMVDETEALKNAMAEIDSTYEEAVKNNMELETRSDSLVGQLIALSSKTTLSNSELSTMQGIVDKLNDSYDDLDLTLDKVTGKINMTPTDLYGFIQQAADEANKKATTDALTDAVAQYEGAREDYLSALSESSNAWDTYEEMEEQWKKDHPIKAAIGKGAEVNWDSGLKEQFLSWQKQHSEMEAAATEYDNCVNKIKDYCEALGYSDEETASFIEQLEANYEATHNLTEATDDVITAEEAVSTAFQDVRTKIDNLCQAYDDAYDAALESFQGQFSLFDEAQAEAEATVAKAQVALDSQLKYWTDYNSNIEVLKDKTAADLGLMDDEFGTAQEKYEALMTYVQSGSEEAAGLAKSMVDNINNGNEEAVKKLADTIGQVQTKQEEAAANVAKWQTNFDEEMDHIVKKMNKTVTDDLELTTEAETAAKNTINSYADQIRAGMDGAVEAAKAVANAVAAALEGNTPNIPDVTPSVEVEGNALGTADSADIFIAGENGPELIVGKKGSTVFPTSETDRLINALSDFGTVDKSSNSFMDRLLNVSDGFVSGLNYLGGIISTSIESALNGGMRVQETRLEADSLLDFVGSSELTNLSEQRSMYIAPPKESDIFDNTETSVIDKKISLEISGSGKIEIPNSFNRSDVLNIMIENIKPVLIDIIEQEKFEGGDEAFVT